MTASKKRAEAERVMKACQARDWSRRNKAAFDTVKWITYFLDGELQRIANLQLNYDLDPDAYAGMRALMRCKVWASREYRKQKLSPYYVEPL